MVAVRRYDCVVELAIAAGVWTAGDTRDDGAVNPGRAVGAPGSGEQLISPRTATVIKPEDRMAQFPPVPCARDYNRSMHRNRRYRMRRSGTELGYGTSSGTGRLLSDTASPRPPVRRLHHRWAAGYLLALRKHADGQISSKSLPTITGPEKWRRAASIHI